MRGPHLPQRGPRLSTGVRRHDQRVRRLMSEPRTPPTSSLEGVLPEVACELVTNAYRHTKGPASLRLTALGGGQLRVGVWDTNPHIPAPFGKPPGDPVPPAPVYADGGRGLRLVQEYADSWGGRPIGDGGLLDRGVGKLLWFEVGAGRQCAHG